MAVLLQNQLTPENMGTFEENCKANTIFFSTALFELKTEYQNNYGITVVLAKIKTFKFPV